MTAARVTTASRLRPGRRFATLALALLLSTAGLSGCASDRSGGSGPGSPIKSGDFSTGAAKQLFTSGLDTINKIYIEPVQISTVALKGLQGLTTIDPDLKVDRVGDTVRIAEGPKPAATVTAPGDQDSRGWAAVIAAVLASGREISPKLQAASAESLYQAVFDGSLHDLDRFSRYAGNAAAKDNKAARDGFGGIGVEIQVETDLVTIRTVFAETPAAQAGLKAGDRITLVDGKPVNGLAERAVVSMLRGPVDTDVTIAVARDQAPAFPVRLRRAAIVPPTITYRREPGNIAYLKVSGFNRQTAQSLQTLIGRARTEMGGDLRGVVLDLRNNPGGLLDQGVEVADLFVNSGRILTTRGRHPESVQLFDAHDGDVLNGLPLAVIINGGSASSAEIVAAALQDLGRAILIGSSSYGKGTVQTVMTMPNDGELTLTWAKLYAPSGYALHRLGVIPNICTSGPAASANRVLADLRGGRLDPLASVTARRTADSLNEQGQLALAATCPTQTGSGAEDVELELARTVLADPALIQRSLRGAAVAAAR